MNTRHRVPQVGRIFAVDRSVSLAVTVGAVALLFGLVARFVGKLPVKSGRRREWTELTPSEVSTILLLVGALGLIFAAAGIYRIVAIRKVFAMGVRTSGEITEVQMFNSGAKRLKFRFEADGKPIEALYDLSTKSGYFDNEVGSSVGIAFNPQRPKQAFLVDAFF